MTDDRWQLFEIKKKSLNFIVVLYIFINIYNTILYSSQIQKTVICHNCHECMSFPDFGWQFFAYFLMWLTVVLLNKLTVFLTSLTAFLVSLTFSWKCLQQRILSLAKLGINLQTLVIFLINLLIKFLNVSTYISIRQQEATTEIISVVRREGNLSSRRLYFSRRAAEDTEGAQRVFGYAWKREYTEV